MQPEVTYEFEEVLIEADTQDPDLQEWVNNGPVDEPLDEDELVDIVIEVHNPDDMQESRFDDDREPEPKRSHLPEILTAIAKVRSHMDSQDNPTSFQDVNWCDRAAEAVRKQYNDGLRQSKIDDLFTKRT